MSPGDSPAPDEIERCLDGMPDVPFRPHAYYQPDGDCIEFLFSDESFYGERVDALVTVYYGMRSKKIVGSLIKGVGRLLQMMPGLRIEIEDGRVKLEHVLTALLWSPPTNPADSRVLKYKKLRDAARSADVETQVANLQSM